MARGNEAVTDADSRGLSVARGIVHQNGRGSLIGMADKPHPNAWRSEMFIIQAAHYYIAVATFFATMASRSTIGRRPKGTPALMANTTGATAPHVADGTRAAASPI